jgi:hypothetical protein
MLGRHRSTVVTWLRITGSLLSALAEGIFSIVQGRRSVTRKKKRKAFVATLRALGDSPFSLARYRRNVRMSSTPLFSGDRRKYRLVAKRIERSSPASGGQSLTHHPHVHWSDRLRTVISSIIRWRRGDNLRAGWLLLGEMMLLMESNDIPPSHANSEVRVWHEGSGLSDCRGAA